MRMEKRLRRSAVTRGGDAASVDANVRTIGTTTPIAAVASIVGADVLGRVAGSASSFAAWLPPQSVQPDRRGISQQAWADASSEQEAIGPHHDAAAGAKLAATSRIAISRWIVLRTVQASVQGLCQV